MHTDKQMNASYKASLVNRHIRRFTGYIYYTTTTWQEHEQIFLSGMFQAPRVQPATQAGITAGHMLWDRKRIRRCEI